MRLIESGFWRRFWFGEVCVDRVMREEKGQCKFQMTADG